MERTRRVPFCSTRNPGTEEHPGIGRPNDGKHAVRAIRAEGWTVAPRETDAERAQHLEASTPLDDVSLVEALRRGDEAAFRTLIARHHASLLRLATTFVGSPGLAEEVVQETWLAVLQGLDRFEGRSSLRTWIYSILTNRARSKGQRESRSVPFSAFGSFEDGGDEPAVEPERFRPEGEKWAGGWVSFPRSWDDLPEERLLSRETRACVQNAIASLPVGQREVITLRDVEGWDADEVCNVLGLSETNQRVLLHRARSKVRRALESYLDQR